MDLWQTLVEDGRGRGPAGSTQPRQLAASRVGRLAAGLFEKSVSVWDINTCERLSEFDTVLDFGGRRLALAGGGSVCIAASYHDAGIAGYDVASGDVIWHRKDVRHPQFLTLSPDENRVYVGVERGTSVALDVATGADVEHLRGVRRVWESSFEPLRLLDKPRPELKDTETGRVCDFGRDTFAILDAAFGPGVLCVAENGGPIRLRESASGWERWRLKPAAGIHVLRVGYSTTHQVLWSIEWPFVHGGPKSLVCFNLDGRRLVEYNLGEPLEVESCLAGDAVITSEGKLIDISTGHTIRRLRFSDHPDHSEE